MVLSICFLIFWWYFWIWVVRKTALNTQVPFWKMWGLSLSLVLLLIGAEKMLYFFDLSLQNWQGFCCFFCVLLGYLLMLFLGIFQGETQKSWMLLTVLGIFLALIGYLSGNLSFFFSFSILLVSVYSEEFLKIASSSLVFEKYQKMPSDFLFFSLMIAIGFSFFENGYYLLSQILEFSWEENVLILSFGRGILSSLLHLLATGLIALILFKGKFFQSWFLKSFFVLLGAFFSGVLVHFLYDYAQIPSFLVYGVVLIGGYFFLTYLFYLSDQMYLEKE